MKRKLEVLLRRYKEADDHVNHLIRVRHKANREHRKIRDRVIKALQPLVRKEFKKLKWEFVQRPCGPRYRSSILKRSELGRAIHQLELTALRVQIKDVIVFMRMSEFDEDKKVIHCFLTPGEAASAGIKWQDAPVKRRAAIRRRINQILLFPRKLTEGEMELLEKLRTEMRTLPTGHHS